MPSFDIVSELDMHEVTNAVDQANRELQMRYDFKGVDARFEQNDSMVVIHAEVDFQLQQMLDVLRTKMVGRKIDIRCLEVKDPEKANMRARQEVVLRQGLDQPLAKKIVKMVKDAKLKVQAQVQGEQVRVTGKKRDDLQSVMALLRESDLELPLQFNNFRD
ncbi:YajQ family cyclic di-GMP-binding protein [uncultured Neptuniibacter sp.]|uniref:YajQ family cyclic di-GMP-binding protein n=1 Tax=uncultured Neptuniibacter sp. TaxID=502143 RepID=UPI002614695E|nr:YajQ family cyclic di-GMP-binding protein [uncultured Neptuniibacter sp.]